MKKNPPRLKGLDKPLVFPNGRVLYFDPPAQEYYDPRSDFYVDVEEVDYLKRQIFDQLRG